MNSARTKLPLLAGIALGGGAALYAATQSWVSLALIEGAAAFDQFDVTGHELNQSLSPIALAALAAALALTIAGRVLRRVLGVLVTLLGIGIAAIASSVLVAPQQSASGRLAETTGISGGGELDLVDHTTTSLFIWVAVIAGVLLVALGLSVVIVSGGWKNAGRKYEAEGRADNSVTRTPEHNEPDRISDWEAMSEGHDPSEDDPREDSQGTHNSR